MALFVGLTFGDLVGSSIRRRLGVILGKKNAQLLIKNAHKRMLLKRNGSDGLKAKTISISVGDVTSTHHDHDFDKDLRSEFIRALRPFPSYKSLRSSRLRGRNMEQVNAILNLYLDTINVSFPVS